MIVLEEAGTETQVAERSIPKGDDFLSREEVAALTPAELTRRTTELAPTVAESAGEAERLRRPVDAVWSALRRSGYFYQFVPKQMGGMATDLESFIDATLPIAEACASTGWTASFCAAHNRNLAYFPVEVQQAIWGGKFPYVISPQLSFPSSPVSVETVEGGLRVTGSWGWGTGVMHADWVIAITAVPQAEGPPKPVLLLVPAAEAEVLDTWHTDGMAGTGSNDVRLNGVFVPEKHVLRDVGLIAGRGLAAELYPEEIYHTPIFCFGQVISGVVAIGAARRALASFREGALERTVRGSKEKQADRPATQIRLAEADVMVATAEMLLRDAARKASSYGRMDPAESTGPRIASRARLSFMVGLCRKAAFHLADGAGSSVHYTHQPFQRAVRDLNVLASHLAFTPDDANELHGRFLLGMKPPPGAMTF